MRSNRQFPRNNSQSSRPGRKLELFFFETIGHHTYLRFTRLAVILILCIIVIPIIALFTLFLFNRGSSNSEQINVNVRSTPSIEMTPFQNVIKQAPTPKPFTGIHMQPLSPAPTLPVRPPEGGRNPKERSLSLPPQQKIRPTNENSHEK